MVVNPSQAMAAKNLLAAIVLNNPQGVATNLERQGIPLPLTYITVELVQQVCSEHGDRMGDPAQVARFMASVLDVPINYGADYGAELIELQARNGGKSLGQISYEIFYSAFMPQGTTGSLANNGSGMAIPEKTRKVLSVVIGLLALLGLFTVLYVLAKATKKIIS